MLNRDFHRKQIQTRLKNSSVVALLGPRQCGKTTLARSFKCDEYFDLERPEDIIALDNPAQALAGASGLIIIDEIQRRPDLFPFLRYFVDSNKKARFLVLGSSSNELIRQSSESLAGRVSYYSLHGFSLQEVLAKQKDKLWLRGGFPRSFMSRSETQSMQWREDYIRTFLERDIPQLGIQIPAMTLRRFWTLLAHYNGQILNYSEIGKNFGISDTTVRKYIDILAGTFMIEVIPPWIANISKRQVKSPKFYFTDTGLFHSLMRIENRRDLLSNPKLGASWEAFVLSNLRFKYTKEIYFWNTQAQAEIDFIIPGKKGFIGIEAKYSDAPRLTPSMRIALNDLELQKIYVVYPGTKKYSLSDQVEVCPITDFGLKLS